MEKYFFLCLLWFLLVPTGRAKNMAGEEMGPQEYEESLEEFYRLSRSSNLETKATCAPQYYRILRQQAKSEGVEVDSATFGQMVRMDSLTRSIHLRGMSSTARS